MYKVQFEVMKEVETGKVISGSFGDKKETKEKWILTQGEVITGSCDYVLINLDNGDHGFLDVNTSDPDENGVIEGGYKDKDGDWFDIRNLKFTRG